MYFLAIFCISYSLKVKSKKTSNNSNNTNTFAINDHPDHKHISAFASIVFIVVYYYHRCGPII